MNLRVCSDFGSMPAPGSEKNNEEILLIGSFVRRKNFYGFTAGSMKKFWGLCFNRKDVLIKSPKIEKPVKSRAMDAACNASRAMLNINIIRITGGMLRIKVIELSIVYKRFIKKMQDLMYFNVTWSAFLFMTGFSFVSAVDDLKYGIFIHPLHTIYQE